MKKTNEEILEQNTTLKLHYGEVRIYPKDVALEAMSQAVQQRDEELEPLIIAMNDYITVLGKELDDCATMLSVHGWRSKRVQEGIDARNKILEIKKSIKP